MWIEAGTWNIVFPLITWWKLSPAQLCYRTLASGEFCLLTLSLNWLQGAGGLAWVAVAKKKIATWITWIIVFSARPLWTSEATGSDFFAHSPWKMKWNEPFSRGLQGSSQALRKKQCFDRKMFFRHCPCETHWRPALKKKTGSAKSFFPYAPC